MIWEPLSAPLPESGALTGPAGDGCVGGRRGVAELLGVGEADSTTHIRCDLVATSLATVCARVEFSLSSR